jgi:hypothetical protein
VQHVDDCAALLAALARGDERAAGPLAYAAAQSADKLKIGDRTAEFAAAAADMLYKSAGPGSAERVRALQLAAAGWRRAGRVDLEMPQLRAALQAAELAAKPDRRTLIDLLSLISKRSDETGDADAALAATGRVIAMSSQAGDWTGTLKQMFERAKMLERSMRFAQAEFEVSQCLWLASRRREFQVKGELLLYAAWLDELRESPRLPVAALIEGEQLLDQLTDLNPIMKHAMNANRAPLLRELGFESEATAMIDAAAAGTLQTLGVRHPLTRRILEYAIAQAELKGDRARAGELRRSLIYK